jgi:hypothetical protein
MKKLILSVAILAATAHATCPISECDYLDPQYKAAFDANLKCISAVIDPFVRAMDAIAILYPRFGIAWRAQQAELKVVASDPIEVNRRFEDRILRTAEPEALNVYNIWQLKIKEQSERCGPIPEPPRRQP